MNQYITIKEAAKLLDICTATLRNWDKHGKITSYRHPINNYRLYIRDELLSFLESIKKKNIV